jgi:hypothetical protein
VVRSAAWLEIFSGFAPHPSPLPKEREPILGCSEVAYDSVFHVYVSLTSTAISPLSLWERARVRVAV